MYSAGYVKDAIASFAFVVAFFIVIMRKNINELKSVFLLALLLAFFADGMFTLVPEYHNTLFGYNTPSYIVVGVAVCFVVLTLFICCAQM